MRNDSSTPGKAVSELIADRADCTVRRLHVSEMDNACYRFPDETRVLPGHGAETTIGAERPALPEWKARGW